MTEHEYIRVDFSLAAVRRSDYKDIEAELREVRDRYAKGGSSLGISNITEGTKISDR